MAALALAFDVTAKDRGASRTLRDIGKEAEGIGDKGRRGGEALKKGIKVGVAAAAAALAGLSVAAVGVVKSASNLQESVNAVSVVFGDAAGGINELGEAAARTVGLSNEQFNSMAVQFSSFATTVAGEGGDVVGVIDDISGRTADFASVMNLDVPEAARVFQSALAGETEPIKKFGIDMSAATVEAYAFAEGIAAPGTTLTEQQKTVARYGLLMQATSKVQGDFANTSDGLANRQRILTATMEDLKAKIGVALLPVAERLFGFLLDKGVPAVERLITEFQEGEGAGGRLRDGLEWVRDKGVALSRVVRDDVVPRLKDLRDWFRDEVLPRGKAVSKWIQDEGVPRLKEFAVYIRDDVVPTLKELRDWFRDKVQPNLKILGDYLEDVFTPSWEALVEVYEDDVKPAIERIRKAIKENEPVLKDAAKFVGLLAAGVGFLATQITKYALPIVIKFFGYLADTAAGIIEGTIREIRIIRNTFKAVSEKVEDARKATSDFIDKLKGIRLPGWVGTLVDHMETIGDILNRAGGGVRSFFGMEGDAPSGAWRGSVVGGGPALARVQAALPSGLRVTSTYRTPEHNARVGGSPTSLHMDRANPAVDIGGPTALLDRFAAVLQSMGGWRQLLWRVKGHFDHIHVAHQGGVVSAAWQRSPGDRPDERTVRTQVGELIVPKGWQAGAGKGTGDTYIVEGIVLQGADLPPEVVEFFRSIKRRSRMVRGS